MPSAQLTLSHRWYFRVDKKLIFHEAVMVSPGGKTSYDMIMSLFKGKRQCAWRRHGGRSLTTLTSSVATGDVMMSGLVVAVLVVAEVSLLGAPTDAQVAQPTREAATGAMALRTPARPSPTPPPSPPPGATAAPAEAPTLRLVAAAELSVPADNRTVIRIAAETWQPYFLIGRDESGATLYSGIMWDLLLMIVSRMNLRFEILRPPDGLWGVELPNGTWNGMLGMIQRQEVDMALGPFAVSYSRTQVVDFPATIFMLPHRVYLPRPRGSSDLSDFVRLYHPLVWLMVLVCAVVLALLVWVAVSVEGKIFPGQKKTMAASSPIYILLYVWGTLMQESWGARSVSGGGVGRWLMGMWFLATLVLMNTYSGLLVATLTVPRVAVPISSVEQLVSQDDIPWRLEQGGIILHTFKTADVGLYKTLLKGSDGLFPDCYASRRDIAQGKFAGLCDVLAGDMMVAKSFSVSGRCDFYSPRENIVTHSYSMVLQKESPLKEKLNFWLQELQERGWVQQLVRQMVNNGTVCNLPPGQEEGQRPPTPLSIQQMWGIFAILATGIGGATVVFFFEVIVYKIGLPHCTSGTAHIYT
ncbi:glutamate receptor ionotropic, kainate glr-3-like [Panulirus ornatus]|uniref:glutamate receptor ionotropic, kainate glr-3-like n=1 Tax=Panulirus ornatus TaxID=150431 RepID=UPI003A86FF8A